MFYKKRKYSPHYLKESKASTKMPDIKKAVQYLSLPVAFFLVELFAYAFLAVGGDRATKLWPLAFGLVWAVLLSGLVLMLPRLGGRIAFGILYFPAAIYAAVQTGYYHLFRSMMWITEFRYASEGSDYFSVLLKYPITWWLSVIGLLALGVVVLIFFPDYRHSWKRAVASGLVAATAITAAVLLPETVFLQDRKIQYAGSDYGRAQSAEAAYHNMFNTHRLYQVCGIYQTAVKDIYANYIFPLTPGYWLEQAQAREEINDYFSRRQEAGDNEMTGLFEGKNVIVVLMESMDDWALGAHTPTLNRMMAEGINFTNFYTPGYGGVRTFNSEFCLNTGSFLSSSGGYAFDYVTNDYRQSLANQLKNQGYSAKVYHYNDPSFYSRGVFSPAMGYEEYVCYEDFVTEENKRDLYDDQLLFDNQQISDSFFREGKKLNFIITRSAHLSYIYNEVLSYWALQKYPQFRGLTGHEEEDCLYLKAKLVDDMFARLLKELEQKGELDNTVIVAMTDHYTYGIKDTQLMLDRSGVDSQLLLEKVPCFIWSKNGPKLEVTKTLNTSDVLPTLLNMLNVPQQHRYLGQDAFDKSYVGYALFPNGSWICDDVVYDATTKQAYRLNSQQPAPQDLIGVMSDIVSQYVRINNQILETNYYKP